MNHVNNKLLIALAVAVLLAIGAASWLSYSRQSAESASVASLALPGLNGQLNAIKTLSISGAENQTLVTLDNTTTGWTVREKSHYPADTSKLRQLLLKLAETRLIQAKTAKAEHYAELGVEDVADKAAKGVLISVDGLAKPLKLLIGNASSNGRGNFARLPEQAQTWLTDTRLDIERNPSHWLNTALTDIAAERIAEVVLTPAQGQAIHLRKPQPGDTAFQLVNLPQGRELSEPGIANALGSALAGLQLEDVQTAVASDSIADTLNHAHFQSFDGILVDVTAWAKDGKYYAEFKAAFAQPIAEQAIQAEIDKAKNAQPTTAKDSAQQTRVDSITDVDKYRQTRLQALQQEVQLLQQRFQGWQFVIPEHKYANLVKSQDELLKPLEHKAGKQVSNTKN